MTDPDPVAEALATLEAPPLDSRVANRIGALAKVEFQASARPASTARWAPALRGVLVPALLAAAAVVQMLTTVSTISRVYGTGHVTSSQ